MAAATTALVGERFGRLVVTDRFSGNKARCRCDCGRTRTVRAGNLRNGGTRSCGCLRRETYGLQAITHGLSRTKEWRSWQSARSRGSMCRRWDNFEEFLADMGTKPSRRHILERPNKAKPYSPKNCRWVIREDLSRSDSLRLTYRGVTLTAAGWAKRLGLSRQTFHARVKAAHPSEALFSRKLFANRRSGRAA